MPTSISSALLWAVLALILVVGLPHNGLWGVLDANDAPAQARSELQVQVRELQTRLEDLETELAALRTSETEHAELLARLDELEARPVQRPLYAYPVPETVTFCGETLPLEDPDVYARFEDEWYRFLVNRHWVLSWMRRSRDAFPVVEAKLAEAQMPDDLKYVMAIESAVNPRAASSAGAVGYWQFIRSTGNRYGLDRDALLDERRNLELATDAAITYLRELHDEFGSWPLALSGYNAGEKRVRDEVQAQGTDDYYSLVLPRETEAYWFKAAVTKILFENAQAYDFVLPDDGWTPSTQETITLRVKQPRLEFRDIASQSGVTYRELKRLNPQYHASYLTRGEYQLTLPADAVAKLEDLDTVVVARSSEGVSAPTTGPRP